MTDSNLRDGDPAVEHQRRDVDAGQAGERARADGAVSERRDLEDRTREGRARGEGQTRRDLGRQRTAEDDSLKHERRSADIARSKEHAISDVTLAREKDARQAAERETGRSENREALSTFELAEAVRLVDVELHVVSETLTAMLGSPGRTGPLSEQVARVRAATDRIQTLLRNVVESRKVAPAQE